MDNHRYAYLFGALLLGIVWVYLFITKKNLRKEMLYISFLISIFGFTEHFFYGRYWEPELIVNILSLNVGAESLILCFFYGGVGAVIINAIFNVTTRQTEPKKKYFIRHVTLALCVAASIPISLTLLLFTKLNFVVVASIAMLFSFFVLAILKPSIVAPSIMSGLVFMIVVIAIIIVTDLIFTNVVTSFWQKEYLLGLWIFKIPIEEYLFHFSLGTFVGFLYEFIEGKEPKKIQPFSGKFK